MVDTGRERERERERDSNPPVDTHATSSMHLVREAGIEWQSRKQCSSWADVKFCNVRTYVLTYVVSYLIMAHSCINDKKNGFFVSHSLG